MARPQRPQLAAEDDLTAPADIDLNAALAPLLEQRYRSPILRPSTAGEVTNLIDRSLPSDGQSLEGLVDQIANAANQYPRRNTHPGFFGWAAPCGLPSDPLAQAMVSALQENVGGYWSSPLGTTVERTVIGWLAALSGFPEDAEGVLLSGGSLSNLTGIAAALSRRFGPEFKTRGLAGLIQPSTPLIVCSQAAHFSIRRAATLLGVGTDNILSLATDDQFRMRADLLEQALAEHADIACVVATAGTTNTGAIDPLGAIAEVCARHGVWLHVDAALGGGGLMSSQLRPRYAGIERADSVTMDLHKWFFQSLDASLLLYRDASAARDLFVESSDYLHESGDTTPEQYAFFHISPELSRRFRALPVYLAMRAYGIERLGRNALHNVECAEYLAALIEADPDLELVVAPQLCILCFRYRVDSYSDERIDALTHAIRNQVQLEGDYLMSSSQVNGRPVLRVCILNHATRAEHVEGLLGSVRRIGKSLLDQGSI